MLISRLLGELPGSLLVACLKYVFFSESKIMAAENNAKTKIENDDVPTGCYK